MKLVRRHPPKAPRRTPNDLGRAPEDHRSDWTFASAFDIKWVRDRGLDHAVEKERNLKPLLNLKNLIKSEPSKSIPLSIIAQNRDSIQIPFRPIDFIRRYPSIFQEFLPGGIGIHPHIKLTPEILNLDSEEQLIYQSENYKQNIADRLLKMLMISRMNKIPLSILDKLKWDLGLPQGYLKTIVSEFPDYFQVTKESDPMLELVCWSDELAVSVMENKVMREGTCYEKGMPIAFPLKYSTGFEMDKKFKNWVDGWQKLPYISPYENAMHLLPKTDEPDKWTVSVLHEILNLFVPKKAEKESILSLGEYMGVRSRFKRALLQHPGIFYVSSKIRTRTVVLRDAYKRDLLIKRHELMAMRYKYIHLMNTVKGQHKSKSMEGGNTRQKNKSLNSEGADKLEDGGNDDEEEEEEVEDEMSDYEDEDESEDEEDEGDDEVQNPTNRGRNTWGRRS